MSNETSTSRSSRGLIGSVGALTGSLLGALFTLVGRGIDETISYIERWLLDAKRAQYGLAVTRILLGLTGLGLLATNFRTRYYSFGSGSAWNGEATEPVSDFPQKWIFSLFHKLALHDVWLTVATLGLAALAIIVTLGWRTKIT